MNTIFGKSEDIKALVQGLVDGAESVCNESYSGTVVNDVESMRDFIVESMTEHYGDLFSYSDKVKLARKLALISVI